MPETPQARAARFLLAAGLFTEALALSTASRAAMDPKYLILRILAVLVLTLLLFPSRTRTHWELPSPILMTAAGAFLAWSALTTALGQWADWQSWGDGAVVLLLFLEYTLLFRSESQRRILWLSWFAALIPTCIYSFIQLAGHDPLRWQQADLNPVGSFMGNRNFLAFVLVATIPIAFHQAKHSSGLLRWLARATFAFSVLTVLMNQSRTAWLVVALYAWLGVWSWKRGKALHAMLLLAVAVCCAFALQQSIDATRLQELSHYRTEIWKSVWAMIQAHPWVGHGAGSVPHALAGYSTELLLSIFDINQPLGNAHDVPLHLAAEFGFIGLGLFGLILAVATWRRNAEDKATEDQSLQRHCLVALIGCFAFSLTGEIAGAIFCTVFSWILLAVHANLRGAKPWVIHYPSIPWVPPMVFVFGAMATCLQAYQAVRAWDVQVMLRVEDWSGLARLAPNSPELLLHQAYVEYDAGRDEAALQTMRNLVLHEPYFQNVRYDMGSILYRQGHLQEAEQEYLLAAKQRPTIAENIYFLALTEYRLGKPHECVTWCEKVIGLQSTRQEECKLLTESAGKAP